MRRGRRLRPRAVNRPDAAGRGGKGEPCRTAPFSNQPRRPPHPPPMPPLRKIVLLVLTLFFGSLATHALWWVVRDELEPTGARRLVEREAPAEPADAPLALVYVYAARTGRWRGIFAHHSWIVVKEQGRRPLHPLRQGRLGLAGAHRRLAAGRALVRERPSSSSRRGRGGASASPRMRAAVAELPLRRVGRLPRLAGAELEHVRRPRMRDVPELSRAAADRDRQGLAPDRRLLGLTPSRTGIQLSLGGSLGVAVGWVEGIELNFLGLVAGLDLRRPALKLPGWGRIGVRRPDRRHVLSRLAKAAPAKDDWTAWSAAPMGGPMMHGSAPAPSAWRPALAGAAATALWHRPRLLCLCAAVSRHGGGRLGGWRRGRTFGAAAIWPAI